MHACEEDDGKKVQWPVGAKLRFHEILVGNLRSMKAKLKERTLQRCGVDCIKCRGALSQTRPVAHDLLPHPRREREPTVLHDGAEDRGVEIFHRARRGCFWPALLAIPTRRGRRSGARGLPPFIKTAWTESHWLLRNAGSATTSAAAIRRSSKVGDGPWRRPRYQRTPASPVPFSPWICAR
jgi:hypothetical protein